MTEGDRDELHDSLALLDELTKHFQPEFGEKKFHQGR